MTPGPAASGARNGSGAPRPGSAPPPPRPLRPHEAAAPPIALLGAGEQDLRRRLVVLTLARLGVATILLVAALGLDLAAASGERATTSALIGVVLAIYGASVGYALALSRGTALRALAIVQIALDLAAWTAVVYVTGGPASPMSFFFVLSTLTAALVLGAGAARVTALVAIAIYGALAIAMTNGALRPLADQVHRTPLSPAELASQIVINVVGTVAVAGLGGSLASRLSRAGGALARLEASRAALTALYEDVVRSIPVALLTCAPDGTIDGANPGASELLGVPASDLLGTPVNNWLPFVPADAFRAETEPRVGDAVLVRGDVERPVAFRAAALYDRDGQARGGLVVLEDRSSVEQLRGAVQRAERLAELGRLAAGMAHEIRNPLGAISGGVELVREAGSLGEEDRELLATVLREVARLNSIVTDMLAFARPRAPDRAEVDVVALARDVVTLANAPGSAVRATLTAAEGSRVTARVDPAQVRQVLWNLLSNAVQASPAHEAVEVAVAGSEGAVTLTVADRGRGIAEEMRERVFEMFYSETARGTGVGLAIVKQIVDAHGGAIEVRARPGGGTEFAVTFPAA